VCVFDKGKAGWLGCWRTTAHRLGAIGQFRCQRHQLHSPCLVSQIKNHCHNFKYDTNYLFKESPSTLRSFYGQLKEVSFAMVGNIQSHKVPVSCFSKPFININMPNACHFTVYLNLEGCLFCSVCLRRAYHHHCMRVYF
jgi:hypothetical protein